MTQDEIYRINAVASKVADAMHDAKAIARDECLWLAAKCRALNDENEVLKARLAMTELALKHYREREAAQSVPEAKAS